MVAGARGSGRPGSRVEDGVYASKPGEATDKRRLPVVLAEAAEESGVREEAAPPRADSGGAGQGGGLRGDAEQDLLQEVVVLERRRGREAAADHLVRGNSGDWRAQRNPGME